MPASRDDFAKSVVGSGLISADELKALWAQLSTAERPKDAAGLAGVLVARNQLTPFQAQHLLSGPGTPLVLNQYVITDAIGAGGMGQVYKAHHKRMKRVVALKVLTAALVKDEAAVKRFQREVEAAAKLSHPNIVQAYDADEHQGTCYLVMEFVAGRDLATLVREHGPLPDEQAVECIAQAARGLAFAHGKGVVHRDIKPANLLLDQDGTVKILDMGLARFEDAQSAAIAAQEGLTQSGQVMGTVDYMAPEQAMDTRKADARADIYSLGCTLYRLLTGQNLYDGETLMQKFMAHQSAAIPSLVGQASRLSPGVGGRESGVGTHQPEASARAFLAALNPIFQKMVAKRPEDRYQSMNEVVAALGQLQPASAASTQVARDESTNTRLTGFLQQLGGDKTKGGIGSGTKMLPLPGTSPGLEATVQLPIKDDTDPKSQAHLAAPPLAPAAKSKPKAESGKPGLPKAVWIGGAIAGGLLLVVAGFLLFSGRNRNPVPPGTTTATNPQSGPAPPLAKAPFDAAKARQHQQAWANYLGMKVETSNSVGAKMILIPPGEFLMGSSDEQVAGALKVANEKLADATTISRIENAERPQQRIVITKPFRMGATEITIGQFKRFSATGYVTEAEHAGQRDPKIQTYLNPGYTVTDESPAAAISWNDAVAYCKWLSDQEKQTYRLPTEAEWEYACRAGTVTQYSFGDDSNELSKYGWHNENAGGKSNSVRMLLPNPFGLFDIHGNLYEWCGDWYDEKWYEKSSPSDPIGPPTGSTRVIRGGYWNRTASSSRSAARYFNSPSSRYDSLGFRVVREIDVAKMAASVSSPPTPPANSTIDLLALIDPAKDGISDTWQRTGMELRGTNATGFAVIEAPYRVPEEYDLTVEFTRHDVQGQVALALTHAQRQFKWVLGFGNTADSFGFDAIADKYVQNFPEARHPELALVNGRRYATKVEVRRDRLVGYLDGKLVTELKTDYSNLSTPSRAKLRDDSLVGLIVVMGTATFHRAELTEVTGQGTRTRAALPGLAPPIAKAPFNAQAARNHQEAWAKHLGVKVETTNSVGQTMVLIPPGEFLMGSTDEQVAAARMMAEKGSEEKEKREWSVYYLQRLPEEIPQHRVTLTRPFLIDTTEVTVRQFAKFVEQAKYRTQAEEFGGNSTAVKPEDVKPDDLKLTWRTPSKSRQTAANDSPVTQVSWDDAVAFCNWLSDQEKLEPCYLRDGDAWTLVTKASGYRLPTEAEWEYACRAGTTTQYWFGDDWKDLAKFGWSKTTAGNGPRSVGLFPANPFGLYDMHGNVWEWCHDWFDGKWYEQSAQDDPVGPSVASDRVFRGGCWYFMPPYSRSSYRGHDTPSVRYDNRGFRCVRVLDVPAATAGSASIEADFQRWLADVAAMSAEEQLQEVTRELRALNPRVPVALTNPKRDGPPKIENGVVTELGIVTDYIHDIRPLRGLAGLKMLSVSGYPNGQRSLSDLAPLAGLSLQWLSCSNTGVDNLDVVRDMPLTGLYCANSKVSSLSPLRGMSLVNLYVDETLVSDIGPLLEMKSLKNLGLKNTKVVPSDVATLRRALPGCMINADDPSPSNPK